MQDDKWYEDVLHVLMNLLPIDLLCWIREWTEVNWPWPFRGQWPVNRILDTGRDSFGYALAAQIKSLALYGLVIYVVVI